MTTAKKPNWLKITLIVLCACVIAGLVLTAVLFTHDPDRTYASARLQFSFNGAGDGKAPNGYPFNVNGIFSDEVIKDALDVAGLTDTYTIEQIRDNLTITGVYPENIVKQMTAYTSLLDKNADQQAAMTDYHATLYSVVLYHDFDTKISKGQLTNLLPGNKHCAFLRIDPTKDPTVGPGRIAQKFFSPLAGRRKIRLWKSLECL